MADETTEDALLGGMVRLRQRREGYRAAIDPILLAATIRARPGDRVLDLGTGTGAAALTLMARVDELEVVGVEIDPATAALARENAALNRRGGFSIVEADIAHLPRDLRGFDQVMSNPPYLESGRSDPSPVADRQRSNMEGEGLGVWVEAALTAAASRGTVTFIQRADRVDELLTMLQGRAGAIVVVPLWPKAGQEAKRVIVAARKGAKTPLRLHPGLVLHEASGAYTAAANAILRGAAFDLGEISRGARSA